MRSEKSSIVVGHGQVGKWKLVVANMATKTVEHWLLCG